MYSRRSQCLDSGQEDRTRCVAVQGDRMLKQLARAYGVDLERILRPMRSKCPQITSH